MAINLNPGADSSIVSAATRAGLASGPGDYSKQFQAIADAYGETMDASVALNKQIMDATLTLAGDSIKNAGERRRAEIALEDTPGGEKLLAKIDGYKNELKKTRGLSIEVEIEDEAAYEAAMKELEGEGVLDQDLPKYEEWKEQTQKKKNEKKILILMKKLKKEGKYIKNITL